jgi:hypothetical protein
VSGLRFKPFSRCHGYIGISRVWKASQNAGKRECGMKESTAQRPKRRRKAKCLHYCREFRIGKGFNRYAFCKGCGWLSLATTERFHERRRR